VPSVPAHEISSAAFDLQNRIADTLCALGYFEIVTHSLRASGDAASVEVRNPISEEHRFLRTSLVPGLLDYFASTGAPVRVFELGEIFARDGERIIERTALAFGFSADSSGEPAWRDSSFLRLKGDCEVLLRDVTGRGTQTSPGTESGFHPGKTAVLTVDGTRVGIIGCVDPRVSRSHDLKANAYLCVLDVAALPPRRTPHYQPPSRFPSTYRDLALVVDTNVSASALESALASALGSLCTGIGVFDEYRGPQVGQGRKSLAVRLTLQRFDRTITDEEADEAVTHALEAVRAQLGATIRT
jgi:phenylalanyl-tRNA synthetase beta chain